MSAIFVTVVPRSVGDPTAYATHEEAEHGAPDHVLGPAMDFTLTQDITGTVDQVEAALTDPGFLATMTDLPKIGSVEVLEQTRDGDTVHQRVRYLFTAELSGAVRRVVDPDKLTWVEDSTSDLAAHTASYRIDPDNYENLLEGAYDATITKTKGGSHDGSPPVT